MAWVTALVAPLFLVVRWLLPVPLNPPYQQVANPLAVHDLTGPLQVARAATSI